MGFDVATFVFELVNFAVLVLLLEVLAFRPLRRGLAERRREAEEREAAVASRLAAAQEREAECALRLRELDDLRRDALRKAGEEASAERARILAQAREDAAADRARAQHLIDAERETARSWVREFAVESGLEVAGRVIAELAPEEAHAILLRMLRDEIRHRSGTLRVSAAGDERVAASVVFARVQTQEQVEGLRSALADATGRDVRLTVREDETLLLGAVARFDDHVLDGSLAGQLGVLRERVRSLAASAEAAGG